MGSASRVSDIGVYLLRWLTACIALIASCHALANGNAVLRFQFLGPGPANAEVKDVEKLAAESPFETLVRDHGGGSWWRSELPPLTAGASELPNVLHFSAAYSATLTLVLPNAARTQRSRFAYAGPAWGLRAQLPILLPTSVSGGTLYLHIDDRAARRIKPQISTLNDYLQQAHARKVLVVSATTALLVLALIAAVFSRSFGGDAYRYLSGMACLMAGYVLGFTGELYSLPALQFLATVGVPLERTFAMGAVALSHLFIVSFLELTRRRPRVARLFQILATLQLLIAAASWVEGMRPSITGALASNLLILLSIPIVLWEASVALRERLSAGRYVLMAWGPALLLLALWIFALQDWLPGTLDIGGLVYCGLALQVAVLLLGLADESSRLRRERDVATDQAWHDPLTGALNRRALQAHQQALMDAAERRKQSLSAVFFDIDHFKRINDSYGHSVGDLCLRDLVTRVRLDLRKGEVLARYGGEEFVLLLPELDSAAAAARAEALRLRIAGEPFHAEAQPVTVTVSFGVSELQPSDSPDALLKRADQALYRAKARGRNQVVQWQLSPNS